MGIVVELLYREGLDKMKPTYEQLKLAFDVAVDIIMKNEPGDSRAVSDIAVALASVSCDIVDDAVMKVIDEASVNYAHITK